MPKTKNPLNDLGVWLMNELNKRNILPSHFALMMNTKPPQISLITRENKLSEKAMVGWREKCEVALREFDAKGE